jgi:hypothetical protein
MPNPEFIILYSAFAVFFLIYRKDIRDYSELRSTVIQDLLLMVREINRTLVEQTITINKLYSKVDKLEMLRVIDDDSAQMISDDVREKTGPIELSKLESSN